MWFIWGEKPGSAYADTSSEVRNFSVYEIIMIETYIEHMLLLKMFYNTFDDLEKNGDCVEFSLLIVRYATGRGPRGQSRMIPKQDSEAEGRAF